MKKAFLYIIALFLVHAALAQPMIVSSECDAPDSIKSKYKEDAMRLALSRVYRTNSAYKDSATIPASVTDTMLKALIAVYNAPIPKFDTADGDTVYFADIHSRPYQAMDTFSLVLNAFSMQADKNQQWLQQLMANTLPTSNALVNTLMAKYHLKFPWFSAYSNWGSFSSDSDYNMSVVAKEWLAVPGVYSTEKEGIGGDGSYLVVDDITSNYVSVVYSYGWGDCPSGCISRKNWRFRVYYDCGVEYLNSWRGAVTMPPYPNYIPRCPTYFDDTVFPNPFTSEISIGNATTYNNYKLADIAGRVVLQGKPGADLKINTEQVPSGVYILKLFSSDGMKQVKLVK